MNVLVTGGAGFIGTNFIRHALAVKPDWRIVNLDALTYAGNPANFEDLAPDQAERHRFIRGDIGNASLLDRLFCEENFDGVIHFAAEESHGESILIDDYLKILNKTGWWHTHITQASMSAECFTAVVVSAMQKKRILGVASRYVIILKQGR